jgi:hypothetical protein
MSLCVYGGKIKCQLLNNWRKASHVFVFLFQQETYQNQRIREDEKFGGNSG